MARIENWMLTSTDVDLPTELQRTKISGNIYNHTSIPDGTRIITSVVMELNIKTGKAKTWSGAEYVLGRPSREWIRWLKDNNYTEQMEDLENLVSQFLN